MAPLPSQRTRIMIVDRCPADYQSWSTAAGVEAEVQICSTGVEAMRRSALSAVLWVINTELPDMPGIELFDSLRPRLRGKCVFLVADRYDRAMEIAALRRGVLHFACKPLTADWLADVWRNLCRKPLPPGSRDVHLSPNIPFASTTLFRSAVLTPKETQR